MPKSYSLLKSFSVRVLSLFFSFLQFLSHLSLLSLFPIDGSIDDPLCTVKVTFKAITTTPRSMDPSNLEDHLSLSSSSSSFSTPSSYVHGATTTHEWNHPDEEDLIVLNTDQFNLNINKEVVSTSKDLTDSMVEDLGLQWPYNTDHSTQQVDYFPKIKQEQTVSFLRLLDKKVKNPSDLNPYRFELPNDDETHLHLLSSDEQQRSTALPAGFVHQPDNFSSPFQTTVQFQSSDLLNAHDSNLALLREFESYGMRCLQRRPDQESPKYQVQKTCACSPGKKKTSSDPANVMNKGGGGNNSTDQSSSISSLQAKRPRIEPKSSFSPFKVRKEKLGDRIAALQQLVAPFGKTDTASVLMEAIGYIKFLQDQVETLCVPYLKSSSSNRHGKSQGEQVPPDGEREPAFESRLVLRNRGLCLVPLSCTSYVTSENVGIWPEEDSRRGF